MLHSEVIVLGGPRKAWRLGLRLNRVLVLHKRQFQNAAFCKESFAFTCLTYKNVQRFRNGPFHEFSGLKACQMSKVRASSHEYPHVEKTRIFMKRISKVALPVSPHGEFAPNEFDPMSTQLAIKCLKFIFLLQRKKDNIVRTMKQNHTKHIV